MTCCDITAADLRDTVTIQRQQIAPDEIGGGALSWTDVLTTRARVKWPTGRERVWAQRLGEVAMLTIMIRYRAGITSADRILIDGRPMQIRSAVNEDRAKRWLTLSVEDGVVT